MSKEPHCVSRHHWNSIDPEPIELISGVPVFHVGEHCVAYVFVPPVQVWKEGVKPALAHVFAPRTGKTTNAAAIGFIEPRIRWSILNVGVLFVNVIGCEIE